MIGTTSVLPARYSIGADFIALEETVGSSQGRTRLEGTEGGKEEAEACYLISPVPGVANASLKTSVFFTAKKSFVVGTRKIIYQPFSQKEENILKLAGIGRKLNKWLGYGR